MKSQLFCALPRMARRSHTSGPGIREPRLFLKMDESWISGTGRRSNADGCNWNGTQTPTGDGPGNLTNAQFSILNSHPRRQTRFQVFVPSDENWELRIDHWS